MRISILLMVFVVICACNSAASVTVTTAAEDYVIQAQRQLLSDIAAGELKITAVETGSADRISVTSSQHQAVFQEIQRAEQSLAPLQALSLGRKHCIQKYKSRLISADTAKKEFAACIATAQVRISTLTTTAKASLTAAKTAANTALPSLIGTCKTTHAADNAKLEECVITAVDTSSKTVLTSLNAVNKNLAASLCTSVDISQDAVDCSFATERVVLQNIGSVLYSINACTKEKEIVCNCPAPNTVDTKEKTLKGIIMGTKV